MIETIGTIAVLPAAFALDLMLGDPQILPHPVRWMGAAIVRLEPFFRRHIRDEFRAGLLFTVTLVSLSWTFSFAILVAARKIHPLVGWIAEVLMVYSTLSVKSLRQAAMAVARELNNGELELARSRVAMIVGRDTRDLSRRGVVRAAVESVAENLVDGVLSPLFYAAIGGAPLALAFKMTSTLDSMIGYKTPRYNRFGKAAARLDDTANFVTARLSVPVIALAARLRFATGRRAWITALREGARHASPNSGRPEAAFAGALGVKLGGPSNYHGRLVHKPHIGVVFGEAEVEHIFRACDLMQLSAVIWLTLLWALQTAAGVFI
jgi:adenosylcobinamide-phosphate synthase